MSYEEFWQKDYLLIESYIKKFELDIERETASNWELVTYIRAAILEVASNLYRDKKSGRKPYQFPDKPESRTHIGRAKEERNKTIANEIRDYFNQKIRERKIKRSSKQ